MYKRIFSLFAILAALAILLCACGAVPADETTVPQTEAQTVPAAVESTAPTQATSVPEAVTAAPQNTQAAAPETSAAYTMPEKKGEMVFTDDPNDKFIQAIVQKYGSDPTRLACIYAVPEADNNHVFEFNGTTDKNGKLVRNADTLKYVYSLNADCTTITRAGGLTGNDGLSSAQGYATFEVVKKLVLPEFEAELNA